MPNTTCTVTHCTKPTYQGHNMCGSHYMKWYRHGDPHWTAPPRIAQDLTGQRFGTLIVTDYIKNQGWHCQCDCGATRVVKAGELNRAKATSCGDTRIHWRHDTVTYSSIHSRVKAERGPASHHPCVDCHAHAAHWSYNHDDPRELEDERGLPYGLDTQHYSPRCTSCHKDFDLKHAYLRQLNEEVANAFK